MVLAEEFDVECEGKRATKGEFAGFGPGSWVSAGAPVLRGPGWQCGGEETFVHSSMSEILKPEWAAALLGETLPTSEWELPGDTAEDSCHFRVQGCSPRKNSQGTSL